MQLTLVSMGNPHAVAFLDSAPAEFPLERIGPAVEHDAVFAHRTDLEIDARARPDSPRHARLGARRGVDPRVRHGCRCGRGGPRLHGRVDDSVEVRLPGGALQLDWDGEGEVYLEGPTTKVFESTWEGAA